MDCSPPSSFVLGILQARIRKWLAIPFSRGLSQPRTQTHVSGIAGKFFTIWDFFCCFLFVCFCFVLEFPCFFYVPAVFGNLISGSSAFSKSGLYNWKFLVHMLLKPSLKDFEHNLGGMWNECNCTVIWTFFGIAFLWDWNENRPIPVLWPLQSFPNLLA